MKRYIPLMLMLLNLSSITPDNSLRAQLFNYSMAVFSENYVPLTNPIPINLNAQGATTLPIGFEFEFDGMAFDTVCVSKNGWLWFGDTSGFQGSAFPLTEPSFPASMNIGGIVSAFGMDLSLNTSAALASSITYRVQGSAPDRVFTVQWKNVSRSAVVSALHGDSINFQISLLEGTNEARFTYGYCGFYNNALLLDSVEVGMRGGSINNFILATDSWNSPSLGFNPEDDLKLNGATGEKPVQDMAIMFSPESFQGDFLFLATPYGGELFQVGDTMWVTWFGSNVNSVSIHLSLDGGVNYFQVAAGVSSAQYMYPLVAQSAWASNNAMLMIKDEAGSLSDTTAFPFAILSNGFQYINIVNPVGVPVYSSGDTCYLEVDVQGIEKVNVHLIWNNGLSKRTVLTNVQASSAQLTTCYFAMPSGINAGDARIVVHAANNPGMADTLSYAFEIIDNTPVGIHVPLIDSDLHFVQYNTSINLKWHSTAPASISLFDMGGRLLEDREASGQSFSMDVEGLKPGCYLLMFKQNGTYKTFKILR